MANSDQYRMTNDTSALQNLEVEADKASLKAYFNTIIDGLKRQMASMAEQHTVTIHNMEAERSQAVQQIKDQQQTLIHAALSEAQAELQSKSNQLEEHKATITRMKTEHDRAIQQIEDKQQHLINTATGEVRTELQGLINKLNYQVTAMTKEKRDLEITHNNTQNRLNRAEKWAEKREAAHLEQIAETRSKVWLQLHFDSKRGHRRTYYRHPHDTLQATYEDLRKSGIITPIAFRYANKRIRLDQFSMTWDQLGVEDGDVIWFGD